jgi:hypothetical protein
VVVVVLVLGDGLSESLLFLPGGKVAEELQPLPKVIIRRHLSLHADGVPHFPVDLLLKVMDTHAIVPLRAVRELGEFIDEVGVRREVA